MILLFILLLAYIPFKIYNIVYNWRLMNSEPAKSQSRKILTVTLHQMKNVLANKQNMSHSYKNMTF